MSDNTPGWQPDPTGKHDHRYWDGSQWTDNISDAGVAGTDAFDGSAAADAGEIDAGEPTVADAPVVSGSEMPPPDATAAWPTTPGAPAAPAPPPPYVPTGAAVPPGGDGGSKKRLLIGGGILAAVAIAVIAFLALSGDDGDDVRTQLVSALEREADLSGDDAECVADFFVDDIGEDAFKGVDFEADEAPPELEEAFARAGTRVIEACDLDESALGGGDGGTDTGGEGTYGSDPELDALYDDCEAGDYEACDDLFFDSPTGSEYEDFGDTCGDRNEPSGTCVALYEDDGGGDSGGFTDGITDSALPDDFEDILADTYEETLGLSREQAECLASALSDDIESGALDEAEAMSAFMEYIADCDISLEELGAN